MRETDASTVMGVEAFGLNDIGAGHTEPGMACGGGKLRSRSILLDAGWSGKKPDGTVSKDSVNVKEDKFDLLGPGFGHGGIVNECRGEDFAKLCFRAII